MENNEWANLLKLASKKKDALNTLSEYIEELETKNAHISKKLVAYNQEEAVMFWKQKYEQTQKNSLYVLSDEESKEAKAFAEKHHKACKSNIRYEVKGVGIGDALAVVCEKCNERKDITDMANW